MIISMTGFGRGEVKKDNKEITVEVRSLNNRFLDVTSRIPKNMFPYEDEIKNIVRKHLLRGRVNIAVTIKEQNGIQNSFKLNTELADTYLKNLKKLKKQLLELHYGFKANLLDNFKKSMEKNMQI